MSIPRRRLVRPALAPEPDQQRHHQVQKLRARLEQERRVLARWMTRLRRAFHTVEKLQLTDFTHRKTNHSLGGSMKDDETQQIPHPPIHPMTEAHPDNADHSIHQYDAIDLEFYIEGAGDA